LKNVIEAAKDVSGPEGRNRRRGMMINSSNRRTRVRVCHTDGLKLE
jgi:hypothetical protein